MLHIPPLTPFLCFGKMCICVPSSKEQELVDCVSLLHFTAVI